MSARELDAIFCCPEGCVYARRTEEDRDALCCKALAGPQMRAALAAAGWVVEQGWQPIETAPRDGTAFHAWVDGECRRVCWTKTSHVPIYGFCLTDQGAEDCDLCDPTAWRPLPAPPAGEATP